jgi:16S rRNA (guanine527-N7)-methyltransferase
VKDPRLEAWLRALVSTPGLTALRDLRDARRVHVDDSTAALAVVRRYAGPIVDVGSGGGAPGVVLAAALPDRDVTLLEANGKKAAFLERVARDFPNVRVVHGRAEEHELEAYGVAVAKALAPPPVAVEWCLPLVRTGGAAVLFVGPSVETARLAHVAERLGGGEPVLEGGLVVVPKVAPTPPGFPRRAGMARKRPLG